MFIGVLGISGLCFQDIHGKIKLERLAIVEIILVNKVSDVHFL